MQGQFVTVDGIRTHYITAGEGRPVVLVQGLGTSVAASWHHILGPLAQHLRVVALDLPGNGDSDRPDVDYSANFAARFLARFLDAIGLERASFLGASAGGLLSLLVALREPERVERLVLLNSAGLGREVGLPLRLLTLPVLGEVLAAPPRWLLRLTLGRIYAAGRSLSQELVEEFYRVRQLPGSRRAVLRALRGALTFQGLREDHILLSRLPQLRKPTLILWGDRDPLLPVSQAYAAARLIPDCRLHVFPECGHDPASEVPQDVICLVREFLCHTGPTLAPSAIRPSLS